MVDEGAEGVSVARGEFGWLIHAFLACLFDGRRAGVALSDLELFCRRLPASCFCGELTRASLSFRPCLHGFAEVRLQLIALLSQCLDNCCLTSRLDCGRSARRGIVGTRDATCLSDCAVHLVGPAGED